MRTTIIVYIAIGILLLMPILYFGLRGALRRGKKQPKARPLYIGAVVLGSLIAIAASWGLAVYSLRSLPMLVMERAVRDAAAGTVAQGAYLAENARVELEGFSAAQWQGAVIDMPKKELIDEDGTVLLPVRLEKDDTVGAFLFCLTQAEGEVITPAKVERITYVSPEEMEEKVGSKMTYFEVGKLE